MAHLNTFKYVLVIVAVCYGQSTASLCFVLRFFFRLKLANKTKDPNYCDDMKLKIPLTKHPLTKSQ